MTRYLACLSSSSSNDKLAFDVGLQEQSEGELLHLHLSFEQIVFILELTHKNGARTKLTCRHKYSFTCTLRHICCKYSGENLYILASLLIFVCFQWTGNQVFTVLNDHNLLFNLAQPFVTVQGRVLSRAPLTQVCKVFHPAYLTPKPGSIWVF